MDDTYDTPDPVIGLVASLRALRIAPPAEASAFELRAGTVAQWRKHWSDGAPAPTIAMAATVTPVVDLDSGELYEALESVENDAEALARVHDAWIRHRRCLGTSVGEAEAVFTRQLEIARHVVDHHGAA